MEVQINREKEFKNDNSFICINVVSGEGIINGASFKAGDSFFVTAGERVILSGNANVLLTDIDAHNF